MKKQLANAIIFLAVTSSALITGRLYSVSQNTPSKLNNSQDISLSKNYKSYEHLLPLFEKAKEARDFLNQLVANKKVSIKDPTKEENKGAANQTFFLSLSNTCTSNN